MSGVLYVDPIGGAAGDMLLAALLDAGAPEEAVREAVDAVLPGRFRLSTEDVRRAGMRARFLRVEDGDHAEPPGGSREPRPHAELVAAVERADLSAPVRDRALSILGRLGQAEARVHGVAVSALALDELGDDDTLLDVVGVSAAVEALGVDRILVGPLPLGTGTLPEDGSPGGGHGEVHLPAGVTLELLRGFAVEEGPPGETVTPTAAAILAAVGTSVSGLPAMSIRSVGHGAGTRDSADRPNVVRVVVGEEPAHPAGSDATVRRLAVVEANLDDLTPELLADAVRAVQGAGALDVWTTPVVMKKGRPGVVLSALCEPGAVARVERVFFESTPTFGVRTSEVRRTELARRVETVSVAGGTVRVKVGSLGGRVVTATPEHDDVADVAARLGVPVRQVYEEAASAARDLRLLPSDR